MLRAERLIVIGIGEESPGKFVVMCRIRQRYPQPNLISIEGPQPGSDVQSGTVADRPSLIELRCVAARPCRECGSGSCHTPDTSP
jgi:hypothetical protein